MTSHYGFNMTPVKCIACFGAENLLNNVRNVKFVWKVRDIVIHYKIKPERFEKEQMEMFIQMVAFAF